MSDQVINYDPGRNPPVPVPPATVRESWNMKRISWAAVFAGVLVALATELLLVSFGLFIGFRLSGREASIWSVIWYFVTSFLALYAGGWVAARLSGSPEHGKLHGVVTWGLATVAAFAFTATLSWGMLSQSLGMVRTAALAAAPAATSSASADRMTPSEADRMANQAQQQTGATAANVAHDVSWISLVAFIGMVMAALGSVAGGASGAPRDATVPRAAH